jgi:hypothetical protein
MPLHQEAEKLIEQMWNANTELWISRQVLREFLVQALFRVADETQAVTEQLLYLLQTIQLEVNKCMMQT